LTATNNELAGVHAQLKDRLGRRGLLRAAAGAGALTAAASLAGQGRAVAATSGGPRVEYPGQILQPGRGPVHGRHYLRADADEVRWGYVPALGSDPVLRMRSGETLTVDTVSHEGLLEDQGRDPLAYFRSQGVPADRVLKDAVALARDYDRTPRNFDVDGPHVVIGPVAVEGAEPGDVLKVEPLSLLPRVPYGVISSRHGKGALARRADGGAPDGIGTDEVMPPVGTDGRGTGDPEKYGNVSVFTPVERSSRGAQAVLPLGRKGKVRFPLAPHMGMMGVAFAEAGSPTDPLLNSIPPTLGGGNIDIRHLGENSAFYLPVFDEGALFYVGDPHLAMGNGEAALTALEGSLRATYRVQAGQRRRPVGRPSLSVRRDEGRLAPDRPVRPRRLGLRQPGRPGRRDAPRGRERPGLPPGRSGHGPRDGVRLPVGGGGLRGLPGRGPHHGGARRDRQVPLPRLMPPGLVRLRAAVRGSPHTPLHDGHRPGGPTAAAEASDHTPGSTPFRLA